MCRCCGARRPQRRPDGCEMSASSAGSERRGACTASHGTGAKNASQVFDHSHAPEDGQMTTTQQQSVARGGLIASAAVMVSRVFGLLRETLLAAVFGASREYDAFLMAFRIPNLLRDLFAEGALSQAFVKVFKETS